MHERCKLIRDIVDYFLRYSPLLSFKLFKMCAFHVISSRSDTTLGKLVDVSCCYSGHVVENIM
jgi:hypothetical protein